LYTITLLTCHPQVSTSSSESDDGNYDQEDDDGLLEAIGGNGHIYEQSLGDVDELLDEEESNCADSSIDTLSDRKEQER